MSARSDVAGAAEASEVVEPTLGQRVWDQASTLGLAILIALAIRAFVIEPFRIPSGSMLPTLLIGDHLFVNKFIYGIKVPFADYRLPGLREPERGDVVVFSVARGDDGIVAVDKRPDLPRDDFVKRIVGLPGDRIEVRNGRLLVDGERVEMVQTGASFRDETGRSLAVGTEELGECSHAVLDNPALPGLSQAPYTVESGRYFMMGDNRDHSRDSRDWGTVRLEEFKGPAFLLYWSWAHNGNFLGFLNPINWFTVEKRWDRVFQLVRCEPYLNGNESAARAAAGGAD